MLYSDDMAEACAMLMELPDDAFDRLIASDSASPQPPLVNIGLGQDYTIRELAERVRQTIGFQGKIEWDLSKPDGTPRKLLDVGRMKALGRTPCISLETGLRNAYQDFLTRFRPGNP